MKKEFTFGDMLLSFLQDEEGRLSMSLIPSAMAGRQVDKACCPEPLVQLHAEGDPLPRGYGNGMTLATTLASDALRFCSLDAEDGGVTAVLASGGGRIVRCQVRWEPGWQAFEVRTVFENRTDQPVRLDLLSSVNLSGMTPFSPGDTPDTLVLHRFRSAWSAEGRLCSQPIEEAMLERSWTGHALRIVRFGQVGSMPVRGYFPFAALEDRACGVTWAMQLACPSSWQMEIRRKDDCLNMMASLADGEYGHWVKTVAPGESFETPPAYITVSEGGVDTAAQRLLTIHRTRMPNREDPLPVLFNEYCSSWGTPDHRRLEKIADTLRGHDIDYLVIDAGWYRQPSAGWSDCGGDWIPEEREAFPFGLKAAADMIRARGMKPGLWFEPETCAPASDLFRREDLLLKRNGRVIDTDGRRFLDMRLEQAQDYLDERVIGLLKKDGFEYIKIDYNDSIGLGCDDPDSLGEGLRQCMLGTQRFFRRIRERIPGIRIENCSSGGHRLEPSMMALSDMASFSDAHECPEIPIIAAAVQRMILPAQSQIWAVLRKDDSLRRLHYSLISTFLGVMCLSGDVDSLPAESWEAVDRAIAFYRSVSPVIRDGVSDFYGQVSASWRHPRGWQAVCRACGNRTLAVVHTFGGSFPPAAELPVRASVIRQVLCSGDNRVSLSGGILRVELKEEFEAVAVDLEWIPSGDAAENETVRPGGEAQ